VIGAGAAGIAAARRLAEARTVSVLVLEARDRAGGRAWTVEAEGLPMDLGCEWLHSADRNAMTSLAESLGFAINKVQPSWVTGLCDGNETEVPKEEWVAELEAHHQSIHRAALDPVDRPASTVLAPGGRWNTLFNTISTWVNAVELDSLSVKDIDRSEDTGINWRLHRGYGTLFMVLAEGLPIAYGSPVSGIDHRRRGITITSSHGTVTTRRVIVAVPTTSIAQERLRFDRPLPDKMAAATGLPLGVADKLFFHFDGIMEEQYLLGSTTRRETMSYQVRPFGRPRIHCFFGGRFAASLERAGFEAMVGFATDELVRLLGADVRRQLRPLIASFWGHDEFALGSYSYAMPGHADDRALLAQPVDDRIFFAGEACSLNFFSTAHGAYETGTIAAEGVLRSLC